MPIEGDDAMDGGKAELLQAARSLFQNGDLKEAANLCRDGLKDDPDNWEFLHLIAMTLNEAGLADQALPFLQRCLAVRGADSAVLFNYGVVLRKMSRFHEAVRAFRHAAEASPERFDCWFNLGETLRRFSRLDEAVEALSKAADIEPDNPDVWFNLGNVHLTQAHFDAAIDAFEKTVKVAPGHAEALNNLGLALKGAGRTADAIAAYRRAIDTDPVAPAPHDNLGNALAATGDLSGAVGAFREALRLKPDYADALYNLAGVFLEQRNVAAAEAEFRRALKADPDHREAWMKAALCRQWRDDPEAAENDLESALGRWPGDAVILAQLGNVMRDIGAFDRGRDYFGRALELSPDNPIILGNLALAYQHEGKLIEAFETYRHALNFDAGNEKLHSNLAQALLLGGHYREGWIEFEHRLADPAIADMMEGLPGAPWNGEPLHGKTILLRCEQGLGDIIQFARYAGQLADNGARVLLAGPGRLATLLNGLKGLAEYVDAGGPLPDADYHAPLMSLPHRLDLDDIPAGEPYLAADPGLVAHWRDHFMPLDGIKIGIAWQGNPNYEMDYARSLPLANLAQLIEPTGAHFVLLQQGFGREQLAELPPHLPIVDPGEDVDREAAFADTAAIMANLDLIITSDTAIPHLAGALGRPVWTLLPFAPDWRFMLGRADCPWYPSMRLFRQAGPRDWPSALRQAGGCLARWLEIGGDPNAAADATPFLG